MSFKNLRAVVFKMLCDISFGVVLRGRAVFQRWLFLCLFLIASETLLFNTKDAFYFIFRRYYLFIFRGRGREGERGWETLMWERNISCLLYGPWVGTDSATQACSLTRYQTGDLYFVGWCSTNQVTPVGHQEMHFKMSVLTKIKPYIFVLIYNKIDILYLSILNSHYMLNTIFIK